MLVHTYVANVNTLIAVIFCPIPFGCFYFHFFHFICDGKCVCVLATNKSYSYFIPSIKIIIICHAFPEDKLAAKKEKKFIYKMEERNACFKIVKQKTKIIIIYDGERVER